jgi:phosphate transport system substrate-binding protein
MLTGGPPFGVEGATEFYVKDCHVRNSPPPMREINPAISSAVEEVVLKCLEKEPANRFQSCGNVMRALDAAIRGEESELQMAGGAVAYETQADGHMPVRRETSTEQVALADMPPPFSAVQPPPVPPPYQPPPYANNTAPKKGKRGFLLAALAVVALIAAFFGYGYYFLWPEKVLTMEGSTTVGLALAPAMVQSFLKSEGGTDIRLDEGHGAEKNQFKVTARMPGKARRQMYLVIADGSGKAFEALEADKVEIGMSSRPINDKEFQRLSAKGDFRSSACENVIALDGLAIIVNRTNPIRALTRAQIRSIYKGKVTDWSELGGASGPIHMFTRDNESGTFDSFVATVMSGDKSISKAATKKENGEEIADAVAGDPNAIGFVGLAQVAGARALAVSDGTGTAALQPTAFTVATEDYILSRRLFLYTPPKISKETEKFIAFATSDDGQQVVKKTGYVPLQATIEKVTVAGDAPADYRALTAGKHRMQLDFRFRPDSTELDTKALADIGRAASSLANGSTVYLLGFADSQGAASLNRELSQRRAEAVRSKLQELGIRQIEARGLSSEMPVGDNSTPEGRQKNRRVEVWVP